MATLSQRRAHARAFLALPALLCFALAGCNAETAAPPKVAAAPAAPVEAAPQPAYEPPRYLPAVTGNGKPRKPRPKVEEEFEETRQDTAMLQFTASWCPPCQVMRPIVDRLIAEGYPIRRHDFDARKKFAHSLNVHSVPTFIVFVKGEEVYRFSGSTTYENMVQLFRKYKLRRV